MTVFIKTNVSILIATSSRRKIIWQIMQVSYKLIYLLVTNQVVSTDFCPDEVEISNEVLANINIYLFVI